MANDVFIDFFEGGNPVGATPEVIEGDTVTLSDQIELQVSKEKVYLEDTVTLSDEVMDNHATEEETITLSDEILIEGSSEFYGADSVTISDDLDLSYQIEDLESITLSESTNIFRVPKNCSKIISHNDILYLVTDDDPVQLIKVDISGSEPSYEVYDYNESGETYKNAQSAVINGTFNKLYVACANGLIAKSDLTSLGTREEIDVSDTDDFLHIASVNDIDSIFASTNMNPTAELYEIDQSVIAKFNTDLRLNQQVTDSLQSYINTTKGDTVDTDFRYFAITTAQISTDLRYLKEAYLDLEPVPRYDSGFDVKINDVTVPDVDLSSITIHLQADEPSEAMFTLARKHDRLNYTEEGVSSEITNQNNVKIYINTRLVFEGKIKHLNCIGNGEHIQVTAEGDESEKGYTTVNLPLPNVDERVHLYHVLLDSILLDNPYINPDDETPDYYLGTRVNLGVLERERVSIWGNIPSQASVVGASLKNPAWINRYYGGNYVAPGGAISMDFEEFEEFIPKQGYTYFWFVKGIDLINNRNFGWVYIGTSLGSLSTGIYQITDVYAVQQKVWENDRSNIGTYSVGSPPYREVSTKNGKYVPALKLVDREDGLYVVKEPGYSRVVYAMAIAQAEYDKLETINGTILPKTSADIKLTIDAYLYYNLKVLSRINITNTTETGVYTNNNGFPVAIKQITIDSKNMEARLTVDNSLSIAEMDAIDDAVRVYSIVTAVDYKIADKYDLPKDEYTS